MPEIEGLTTGEQPAEEHDPNTLAGFTAMLAAQAGKELSPERVAALEDNNTSVTGGLTTESPSGQPRTEDGRFAPAATPAEEPEKGAAPEEEETVEVDPRDKQIADAQEFIGRQSSELGELRERLAKMEGMLEERGRAPEPTFPDIPYDRIEAAVEEQGGPKVIQDLAAAGYPDGHSAYDLAFQAWAEEEPGKASAAYTRYLVALRDAPAAPAQDPRVDDLLAQQDVDTMVEAMAKRHPDLATLPIEEVSKDEATPLFIKQGLDSPDVAVQEQALEAVIVLARARVTAGATAQVETERKSAVVAAKQAAQVATGSLRPVESGSPDSGEETVSKVEATKAFQERILGLANRTSIKDGLTFADR